MSWLIPPKTHPLLLFSPFSLLFSFIYITHSNPPLLYFPSLSPPVTICLLLPCLSSPHPLLLSPVPLLLCLLIPCPPSPHPLLLPLFSCYPVPFNFVTIPLFLCYSVSSYPVPPSLSCKECLPVLSTGAFTLSKTRPFKHAEHAFLAPWRRPSCPLNMPFLETRVQVFDSKDVTIVKETDMMSLSKWFG